MAVAAAWNVTYHERLEHGCSTGRCMEEVLWEASRLVMG